MLPENECVCVVSTTTPARPIATTERRLGRRRAPGEEQPVQDQRRHRQCANEQRGDARRQSGLCPDHEAIADAGHQHANQHAAANLQARERPRFTQPQPGIHQAAGDQETHAAAEKRRYGAQRQRDRKKSGTPDDVDAGESQQHARQRRRLRQQFGFHAAIIDQLAPKD